MATTGNSCGHVCGSEQNVQALKVSDKKQTPITEQKWRTLLYREPSINASYQVSIHMAKRFQRRRFF
jgi:hypothetical protein